MTRGGSAYFTVAESDTYLDPTDEFIHEGTDDADFPYFYAYSANSGNGLWVAVTYSSYDTNYYWVISETRASTVTYDISDGSTVDASADFGTVFYSAHTGASYTKIANDKTWPDSITKYKCKQGCTQNIGGTDFACSAGAYSGGGDEARDFGTPPLPLPPLRCHHCCLRLCSRLCASRTTRSDPARPVRHHENGVRGAFAHQLRVAVGVGWLDDVDI